MAAHRGASSRRLSAPLEVNGDPGALFLDAEERLIAVVALDIGDGEIRGIRSIVNPDKLMTLAGRRSGALLLFAASEPHQ